MRRPARVALSALSLAGAAALLAALPYVVGADWERIGAELGRLGAVQVAGLTALWFAGLAAYTFVLTASLPGLRHHRALLMNAVGSAVSNLLPLGGAAGVAVTFAMGRGWGHRNAALAVSTLVTGVWNVMARLLLPAVGIVALLLAGRVPDERLATLAWFGAAVLLAALLALVLALRSEEAARALDGLVRRLALRLPGRPRALLLKADGALLDVRNRTLGVLRTGGPGLTLGMIAYLLLQAWLLQACLGAVGAGLGVAETAAVFAINRMLTTAVVTPSGAGISETGTAALLLHFGVAPGPAAAATVLYSFYTFAIEVPFGGLAWLAWTAARPRGRAPADGAARAPGPSLVKK
ncbi:lysylphosphatidylglycerol synthase domain-containing protein [Actinomadura parmotrematis]|uniref:Flippase-like domain-containing protein n=1 Tax=Actinomadura parmotrematis TaxID=2864039 RepID=A0ABS7FRK7_9ACTN|nr:lysylphosphatidylglycerol synthase domain-containing protein [Actinomadura parmotrematis]MBW8483028.1 flippase-like domain-containing protein [Actinomadura parmotrematis]